MLYDLNIDLWAKITCLGHPDYWDDTVNWAARIAFENFNGIENLSGMRVAVFNRYDLGFFSSTRTQGAAYAIEDWQTELTK